MRPITDMKKQIIEKTKLFVQKTLISAEGGHDWWHIERVTKLAKEIGKTEKNNFPRLNLFVIELGALLHDIADLKFHNGDEEIGPQTARTFLEGLNKEDLNIPEETIAHIVNIISNISYKGARHIQPFRSPELDIIQDADRLDALGAIGIARTFSFGGYKNHPIYNPNIKPNPEMTKEEYKHNTAPTINHFYEKLLLLKERMNTRTGKEMADHRHRVMEDFLDEFFREWAGEV